jgi:2-polyprenyl-6-methoxyphenol hydroxylase-like FAD-dependent oxidoreductase
MLGNQSEYRKKKTAIVIGGSIAGMLAARVLSDSFEKIMIIEKDGKQQKGSPRKGVPQAAQGHVLLKSGEKILEDLFPGLRAEMIKGGSVPADFANDIAWHHHGSWKIRYNSGCSIIQQSRPFLEYHLRKRIDQIENIHTLYNTKVKGFTLKDSRITGVEAETAEGTAIYPADLTVDASGASSLALQCLKKLGVAPPKKTEITIHLFYAN